MPCGALYPDQKEGRRRGRRSESSNSCSVFIYTLRRLSEKETSLPNPLGLSQAPSVLEVGAAYPCDLSQVLCVDESEPTHDRSPASATLHNKGKNNTVVIPISISKQMECIKITLHHKISYESIGTCCSIPFMEDNDMKTNTIHPLWIHTHN